MGVMGGVSRKKRIVGNGRTRATKSCELLRVPPLDIIVVVDPTSWVPNVFPTHWARTMAKLLSWNCLPCTGNPCSSNLMKLRELCVIKVARVCRARNESWAETPNPGQTVETRRRMRVLSHGKLLRTNIMDLYVYIQAETIIDDLCSVNLCV